MRFEWSLIKSVVAEVYPALWNKEYPREERDPHQHDAYSVAMMLRQLDLDGRLQPLFEPDLDEAQRKQAETEGWILGLNAPTRPVRARYVPGCPFCDRMQTDQVIARNELAAAIPDHFPLSDGHTLIVPIRHEADFFKLSGNEQEGLLLLVRSVRRILDVKHSPDGYNIGVNVGAAAGQTVDHVHVHVIPRYSGDVADPRGGVRWVLRAKAQYWSQD